MKRVKINLRHRPAQAAVWKLPEPLDLGGPPRIPPEQWRELANSYPAEQEISRLSGKIKSE
jgi:hypothetical protein